MDRPQFDSAPGRYGDGGGRRVRLRGGSDPKGATMDAKTGAGMAVPLVATTLALATDVALATFRAGRAP